MAASKTNGPICLAVLLLVGACGQDETSFLPAPDSGVPTPSNEQDDDGSSDDDAPDDDVGDDDSASDDDAVSDDDDSASDDDVTSDDAPDDDVSDDDTSDDDAIGDDDVTDDDVIVDALDASAPMGSDSGTPLPPNTDAFRAGSRLRATVFDDGAGASQFLSLFDTETGQHCHFEPSAEDVGAYYCVRPGFSYPPRFADAACTELVAIPGSSCSPFAPGDLVTTPLFNPPPCSSEGYVYRKVLEPIVPETLFEISGEDGTCQPSTIEPATTYYATEAPDMSDYVRATKRTEIVDEASGLGVSYLDGEDGSSVQDGLSLGDSPCYEQPFVDTEERSICLPPSYGFLEDIYGSADCTAERLAEFSASSCDAPEDYVITAYETDASGCFRASSVFKVGNPFEGPLYRNHGSGMCDLQELSEGSLLYSFGAQVSLDTFPSLRTLEHGDGRLMARIIAAGEERATTRLTWFDQDLGVPCEISKFSDGTRRCVPQGRSLFTGQYFADDACTESLYSGTGAPCEQDSLDIVVDSQSSWDDELDRCTTQVEQVLALESYDGPVYAMAGTCDPVEPEVAVFELGSVLSPDELAEVSLSTP